MDKIEDFVKTYSSKKTRTVYRNHLENYFKLLATTPDTYFKDGRDYEKDITDWWNYNLKKAPMTCLARLSCVKMFLEENDILIPTKIIKRLKRKRKGNKPLTLDRIPTNSELKKILAHGGILEKALFLFASSSGMRINEILNLVKNDIEFDPDPVKIYIRADIAKFHRPRVCFISNEAKDALIEWLKVRDEYLKTAVLKTKGVNKKRKDDSTIFCISYSTANKKWIRMLKKSGFNQRDESTKLKFHRLHIHTLRKFYKTRMLNAGVQEAIIKKIIGQEDALGKSYDRFTEEELINGYKQGVSSILVYESQPDLSSVNEQLREKDEQIRKIQENMKIMQLTMQSMKNELEIEKIKNGKH